MHHYALFSYHLKIHVNNEMKSSLTTGKVWGNFSVFVLVLLIYCSLAAKQPISTPPVANLYTLHADGLTIPSYIVGPKLSRRALQVSASRSTRLLDKARMEHMRLVVNATCIASNFVNHELYSYLNLHTGTCFRGESSFARAQLA